MVKLHTQVSLLVITLATGSVLASSNKFQRREFNNQVQSSGPQAHFHQRSTTLGGFGDEPEEEAFDDLEARRERPSTGVVLNRFLRKAWRYFNHSNSSSSSDPDSSQNRRRELEDSKGPFEHDLDVEELFGRESYLLDERDVIDNGDLFVRDFGTEELFGREYDLLDERDIIDNFEAGEIFGRYDSDFLD